MHYNPEVTLAPGTCGKVLGIARELGIRCSEERTYECWQIVETLGKSALVAPDALGGFAVTASPSDGALARRMRTVRRTDPLPRAIGLLRSPSPTVVDATAGLGRDALVLSRLGCTVTAIERHPALCLLLRLAADETEDAVDVVCADAIEWLHQRTGSPVADVVYLDPMFAATGQAQVKKEMQACRALAHPSDEQALLAAARAAAGKRVVVKRHPHLDSIADDVSFQVRSARLRFDVYLTS